MLDRILAFIATFLTTKTYTVTGSGVGTLADETQCMRFGNVITISVRVTDLPSDTSGTQTLATIPTSIAPRKIIYTSYGYIGIAGHLERAYAFLNRSGQIRTLAPQVNAADQMFITFSYII